MREERFLEVLTFLPGYFDILRHTSFLSYDKYFSFSLYHVTAICLLSNHDDPLQISAYWLDFSGLLILRDHLHCEKTRECS